MGEVVVAAGDRIERPTGSEEQAVINAIMKVTRDTNKNICFVEGHGERDMNGSDAEGYAAVTKRLKDENYETKAINLVSTNQVPSDCAAIVIAGPKKAFIPQEAALVGKYLDEGGKV